MTDQRQNTPSSTPPLAAEARTWGPLARFADRYGRFRIWSLRYRHIAFQTLLCLFVLWAMLSLSPAIDVMRALAEGDGQPWTLNSGDPQRHVIGNWIALWFACLVSGITLWYWPSVLYKFSPGLSTEEALRQPRAFHYLRRGFGVFPFLLALVSVFVANDWSWTRSYTPGTLSLALGAAGLLVFFGARFCLFGDAFAADLGEARRCWLLPTVTRTKPERSWLDRVYRWLGEGGELYLTRVEGWFVTGTFLLSLAILLLLSTVPFGTWFANFLGAPALLFLAVGMIVPGVSVLIWLTRGIGFPLFGGLVVLLFVASYFNDNHEVMLVENSSVIRPTMEDMWERWDSVHDGDHDPVIIVASPGGASRAAYWTGSVLSGLDRRTHGRFSEHVFAISAVSGGTLGAYDYAAWLSAVPDDCRRNGRSDAFVKQVLGADYLAPVVGGLLFPDMIQRFSPVSVLPSRGRFLEESFRQGWNRKLGEAFADSQCGNLPGRNPRARENDVLDNDYASIWNRQPDATHGMWVPLVFANSTHVETGRRVIVSPVQMTRTATTPDFSDVFLNAYDFYRDLSGGQQIDAASAIHNSARFPIISPAGRLPGDKGHLVDGGYFDSSGLITAYDLARYVASRMGKPRPDGKISAKRAVIIVDIDNTDAAPAQDLDRFSGPGDCLDPPAPADERPAKFHGPPFFEAAFIGEGFWTTWVSRQHFEAKRLSLFANGSDDASIAYLRLGLPLGVKERPVALNWSLSHLMRKRMDDESEHIAEGHPGAVLREGNLKNNLQIYQQLIHLDGSFPLPKRKGPCGGATVPAITTGTG